MLFAAHSVHDRSGQRLLIWRKYYGDRFDGLWSGLWIERVLRIYLLSEREYLCSGYHYTLCDTGNCYGNMLRNADHTSGNNLWPLWGSPCALPADTADTACPAPAYSLSLIHI